MWAISTRQGKSGSFGFGGSVQHSRFASICGSNIVQIYPFFELCGSQNGLHAVWCVSEDSFEPNSWFSIKTAFSVTSTIDYMPTTPIVTAVTNQQYLS
jgi:hypothetical protein